MKRFSQSILVVGILMFSFALLFEANSYCFGIPQLINPIILKPNFPTIFDVGLINHVTVVTSDDIDDLYPCLTNGHAYWYKKNYGIYMWRTDQPVSSVQKVTDATSVFDLSAYDEKFSVFQQYTINHVTLELISMWDGAESQLIKENAREPSLFGDNIAFAKWDGHDYEIVIKKGLYEAQLTNNDVADRYPSLYGETVAWQGWDGHDWEIYYWDGNRTVQITNNGFDDKYPSLFAGKIAWQGKDGSDNEIFYWDGSQITQITSNNNNDIGPSLYNGKIAWAGWDGNDFEIYYWDGSQIIQVTNNNDPDYVVSLYNGALLWEHHDGTDTDIMYAEVDVPQKPTASTLSADTVTQTSAILNGLVNPNGQATTYHFEWGASTSYGNVTPDQDAGSGTSNLDVHAGIANLTPGTTYHFRIVAVNPSGTAYGADKTFTTESLAVALPTVTTGSASDVTAYTAVVTGTVNPQGAETRYRFEYGTDTNYGSVTPWFAAGSTDSELGVNATLSQLTPGTTYHFRLVASNSAGTVNGDDQTFTTEEVSDPIQDTRQRFTGWWYNSTQPGTGLALEIQGNKLFLAWFVYDEQGRTIWYASGGTLANATTYTGTMLRFTGWAWGSEPYSPPGYEVAGTVTLVFNKGSNDSISFFANVDGKVVSDTLTGFMKDFAPGAKDSRNITGWWYDPSYNGMGFYLDARGGKMAMVWYNYRDDHSPRWWTSTGAFADGAATYTGALDGWMNGQCLGCPFTSPPVRIPGEGGNITINFTDADHAVATIGTATLNLQRFEIP